jgi:hypothetical protein
MLQPHAGNYDAGDYMTNVLQQRLLMAELNLVYICSYLLIIKLSIIVSL